MLHVGARFFDRMSSRSGVARRSGVNATNMPFDDECDMECADECEKEDEDEDEEGVGDGAA